MNKIVNKFLLVGDTFMPQMHLRQSGLLMVHLQKTRKYKSLKKQEIQNIFIKTDHIRLVLKLLLMLLKIKTLVLAI